jgi:CRP-like cAMP-binding protein
MSPQKTALWAVLCRMFAKFGVTEPPRDLVKGFETADARPGGEIFEVGDEQDLIHIVVKGLVKTQFVAPNGRPVIVQFVRPGYVFGLPAGREPRQLGAAAVQPSVIAVASQATVARAIAALRPAARGAIVDHTLRVLARLLYDKSVLLAMPCDDRIVYTLHTRDRAVRREGAPGLADMPLSRRDLALYAGCGCSAVRRHVKALIEEGVVSIRRGRFVLHRPLPPDSGVAAVPPRGTIVGLASERARLGRLLHWQLNRRRQTLGLGERAVSALVDAATYVACDRGERVPSEHGRGYLCFVVEGAVRVVCEASPPVWVHVARPGQLASMGVEGEGRPRLFRTEAHVPSTVAMIGREAFADVLDLMRPDDLPQFIAHAARVFSSHTRTRCLYLVLSLDARLLHQVRLLACDFPREHERGLLVDLPFTQRELGLLVGARRDQVNRALQRLRRARLVDVVDDRLLVVGAGLGRVA